MMTHQVVRTALITLCLSMSVFSYCTAQSGNTIRPGQVIGKADTVYMITRYDRFDSTTGKVDDFVVSKKTALSWQKSKQLIDQRARDKGANIALVNFIGNYNRAYTAQVSLFYADSTRIKALLSTPGCSIVFFRDNGPSLATYKYDITFNDVTFKDFKDMSFIKLQINDCYGPVRVKINRQVETIQMQGRSRYFRLIKEGGGGMAGIMGEVILVSIAGVTLQEIKDEQLGHLLSEAHKEHLTAP